MSEIVKALLKVTEEYFDDEHLMTADNVNGVRGERPRIPQIRVSNTRLAQAASGCAPSVDVLPIFDVKQQNTCCAKPHNANKSFRSLVNVIRTQIDAAAMMVQLDDQMSSEA
ncbi:hypothetical protein WN51_11966 [Melipona quadrifasciata]|uniref:Uncharacterized protein n=1 Tax=Melipona quadrifasciata TaxID=166423 RepID=A0A0M9A4D4_9HYME|nr:hypothetical protein WN51_11966 [Melipona quadrifasciata]